MLTSVSGRGSTNRPPGEMNCRPSASISAARRRNAAYHPSPCLLEDDGPFSDVAAIGEKPVHPYPSQVPLSRIRRKLEPPTASARQFAGGHLPPWPPRRGCCRKRAFGEPDPSANRVPCPETIQNTHASPCSRQPRTGGMQHGGF